MQPVLSEILEAAKALGSSIQVIPLSQQDSKKIIVEAWGKFANRTGGSAPLWEYLGNTCSVHNEDAWRWVADFLDTSPVLLLIDDSTERSAVQITPGYGVVSVLEECTGFVFYITNDQLDYLLCFNDHDVLIGAGTAIDWVRSRRVSK
jgi:hypothetical protein